jgi:hypothetical protein
MRLPSWAKVPAVLVIGAGLAVASPAMSAVGLSSPPTTAIHIELANVALLANGAAVKLPVRYVCQPNPFNSFPQLSAQITAISTAHTIITAQENFQGPACTGATQHAVFILVAPGQRFKPGTGLAQATLSNPCFPTCVSATDTKAVQLK